MNRKFSFINIIQFILFVSFQVLFMDSLILYSTAFCFIYVGFLLFLPIGMSSVWLLLLGFVTGFTVDMFYDTLGIHAAASVLLAYLRAPILNLLTPRDGYDSGDTVSIYSMGWRWFLAYAVILVLVHHAAVFFLEVISFRDIWYTMLKIFTSTLYTCLVMVILQLLFFSGKRANR